MIEYLILSLVIFGAEVEPVFGTAAISEETIAIVTCRIEGSEDPVFIAEQPDFEHSLVDLTIVNIVGIRTAQFEQIGIDRVWLWGPGLNEVLRVGPHNRGAFYRVGTNQQLIKDYDVLCETEKLPPG